MAKSQTIRFAAGNPKKPFSGVWRLIADKDDIYIGASKMAMHFFKISLHKSGVWVVAGTKESGVTFEQGNRRAKQWNMPLPGPHGITRGPSILVPHTSLGSRPLSVLEGTKHIIWYAGPAAGEMVDFSMYFVPSGIFPHWLSSHSVLGELSLASGSRVVLLASTRPAPAVFLATVEERISSQPKLQMEDPSKFQTASHILMTQSPDDLAIPTIIDMPVMPPANNQL